MKILFVIDSLGGGGAARVTVVLANEFSRMEYDVAIATNLETDHSVFDVDDKVIQYNIYNKSAHITGKISKLLYRIKELRSVISVFRPDVIIGEQENGILYSRFSCMFNRVPIIGHRHNTFKILGLSYWQKLIFNSIDKSVLLHNVDVDFVKNKINNAVAIYNPCTYPIVKISQSEKDKCVIVVGNTKRYQNKGFDLILKIWSLVSGSCRDWKLIIVGGGSSENEKKLVELARCYGIQDSVVFTGFVKNVDVLLKKSSIFALPSRVEGFPMVINEAISQGCACISFSLLGVMAELYSKEAVMQVNDGNITLFADKLKELINNKEERDRMVSISQNELLSYLPKTVINQWVELINNVIS